MTDIEQKALALVNEVRRERGLPSFELYDRTFYTEEALCRAIEQHEAFRQEVSDAVEQFNERCGSKPMRKQDWENLTRFIIAKTDPLVEVIADYKRTKGTGEYATNKDMAAALRAALAARGGRIVWEGE